ncbi:hypothetical protein M501DRAFT_987504 [Patellaria atrata CBS 101060]|uniref:Uncharacterized protein n=1 Tax=Patellaria atrata CBS 101060 TaxID=1346257 RepID=A0A9P4VM70_9PEZI|nr:hypothetical protein M501DRAFT_987504 [Patellaria atrata CBS 101060]
MRKSAEKARLPYNELSSRGRVSRREEDLEDLPDPDGRRKDGEEEEEDTMFLPLGFTRQMPQTFYKGSDPEWQEFKKIAQDPKRFKAIKDSVTAKVKEILAQQQITPQLGDVDKIQGNSWLEIIFPDGPPPEFERPGIEFNFTHGYIAYTARKVSQANKARLDQVLWPKAAVLSTWAVSQQLFLDKLKSIKRYFGLASDTDDFNQRLKQNMEAFQSGSYPGAKSQTKSTPEIRGPTPAATADPTASEPVKKAILASKSNLSNSKDVALPDSDMPTAPRFLPFFLLNFFKEYKRPIDIPRGAVLVTGLVSVNGTFALLTLDVNAIYDPKENKTTIASIKKRSLRAKQQRPKGGP